MNSYKNKSYQIDLDGLAPQVCEYQKTGNVGLLQILWEKISEYIRFYPIFSFRERDEDRLSDFYIYVLERKESLFKKYDHQSGTFSIYLSVWLRSNCLNFFHREKKLKQKNKVVYIGEENFFSDNIDESLLLRDSTIDSEVYLVEKNDLPFQEIEDASTGLMTTLVFPDYRKDPLKYLILKLYYLDFFSEDDFVFLREYTGKQYMQILMMIDKLKEIIFEKKKNHLKMEEKLNKIYFDILSLQEKMMALSKKELTEEDQLKQYTIEQRLNQKRKILLDRYNRFSVFPSFKNIADILGITETKVANLLAYQKKVLEKKLPNNASAGS